MKVIYLFLFFVSFNSWAYNQVDICKTFSFDANKSACMKIINTGHFDPKASKLCLTFNFDSRKLDCITASLNKEYSDADINVCGSISFEKEKAECMANSGRALNPHPRDDTFYVFADLAFNAKLAIERGHVRRSLYFIDEMLRILNELGYR